MACLPSTRVQFPTQVFQMLTPSRIGRCGAENHIYAGDAYLSKGQNNTINKMYPMEHKALSPSYNNQNDENFPRGERKNGSNSSTH